MQEKAARRKERKRMMLTPEQLAAVAKINFGDAMAQTTVKKLLAHIEAKQARIAELEKHQRRSEDDFVRFWDKHGAGNNLTAEAAARMAYGSAFPDYFTGYGDGFDLTCDEVRKRDARISELEKDAARYIAVRGELIGVSNDKKEGRVEKGIIAAVRRAHAERGQDPTAAEIDAAIDAAMQPTWPEDTSDYGSRIAVIGQNGNDALAYQEIKP